MGVKPVGGSSSSPVSGATPEPEVKGTDQGKKPAESASAEAAATASTAGPSSTETQKSEKKLQEQTKSASLFAQLSDGATALYDKASAFVGDLQKPAKPGDKGPAVVAYQTKLNTWRADNGKTALKTDGDFGAQTEAAVKEFQKANGLKADGVLGPETRDRLILETDDNFKALGREDKDTARFGMKELHNRPEDRARVLQTAIDPNFKFVDSKVKLEVLDWAVSKDPEMISGLHTYLQTTGTMEQDPNFKSLNDATKEKLRTLNNDNAGTADAAEGILKFATDPGFKNLSPAHQEGALKAFEQNPTSEYATSLTGLTDSKEFQKLEDGLKTKILGQAQAAPSASYADDAKAILTSKAFEGMTLKQKDMTFNVVGNLNPASRTSLIATMNRDVNGTPAILSKGFGQTGTLLDQLDRLANTNLDARMTDFSGQPIDKKQVLSDLVDEVGVPYQFINQNNRGTCAATSISHKLALEQPAEYARLVTDLASTGQSKLANGDTLKVPSPDVFQSDNSTRSDGERLLQSSLMDYAHPGFSYQNWNAGADGVRGTADDGQSDPTNPTSVSLDGFSDRPGSGLQPDEMARLMKGLTGREYNAFAGWKRSKDLKQDILDETQKLLRDGKGPVEGGIQWGGSGHAVEITDVRDGKVFYRNPWGGGNVGATGAVKGTKANNTNAGPLRTIENGNAAIESIAIEDFKAAVQDIIVPEY